ncbi:TetR/AcrR family transcriptional regulator C-terminal domain-containing protein [Enterococcus pseudoavium]|uniref:TetR/AcrR family transcriptional regulator C-terminal domain-containing protein n=1 Tax=Enterococcus pseudoavium TaxID=44007 RepID=A0AAE4HYT9_9ENTE|nr:TetR/AcrR family transcriptional regulator C-terminal domain-containing protein [Enterococcus pseudoavium]MDT2736495.1 TetR/AcrR family transcriptional regulator C-terminal domain-containing protein [Enterococcus pseudoavium]MDT2755392.1 TetR/AcrR family transcriptional regulator C-terminal domain-containing protein [Enterococcus pseudoavium]MDT2771525.1 TetR/AcrR family transcriptional regulator C-terminal domain-containing protein [Enterococcus pseudoavium]REC32549.1 TetR family transcript
MAEGKATKEIFVQALVALCLEKNYDKITVQDISKKTGLNRQTFYYHFKDKNDLLRYAYYKRGLQYLVSDELSLTNWEESVLEMLKEMQNCHQFYLNTVTAVPKILTREFNQLAERLFVRLFADVDREGQLSVADKEFYARFLAHGCGGILTDWLLADASQPPITIAAQLFRFAKDIEFFAYRLYEKDWHEQ